MKVWLMRASELMPVIDNNDHLLRMGLLGEELSRRGNDVTWFASTFNHFKKVQCSDEDKIIEVKENYRLNLIKTPTYKKNISLSRIINHKVLALKLRKKINKMEKPNLIFASFPTIEMAYEAVKYGKKNDIMVVIDVRDLWPDIFRHNLHGIIKLLSFPLIWYLDIKTHYIMKNASSIVSISELMLEWGLNKGKRNKTEKDKFFYIGYKSNKCKIKKNIELETKLNNEKSHICFFATINNQFNYNLIIDIARKINDKNIDIVVCGQGPMLDKFKKMAYDVDNIVFFGWQEKENLNYILQNSIAGFAPYNDTFDFQMSVSNKFAEYLSHGLPIIITSSGYMKELIDKYNLGVASKNVNEIVKFVFNLSVDKKLQTEISSNAFRVYKEMFDANIIYNDMSKFLEKISKENDKK